jgi:hypothetical protein
MGADGHGWTRYFACWRDLRVGVRLGTANSIVSVKGQFKSIEVPFQGTVYIASFPTGVARGYDEEARFGAEVTTEGPRHQYLNVMRRMRKGGKAG